MSFSTKSTYYVYYDIKESPIDYENGDIFSADYDSESARIVIRNQRELWFDSIIEFKFKLKTNIKTL